MPRRHAHPHWQPLEPLEPRRVLATVAWDGGAGTNLWHDAANWSTDVLPGADDDVVINDAGATLTIHHNQALPTAVRSITNFENLVLSAGVLSTTDLFKQHGNFTMSGGQVAGSGELRVFANLNWSGGAMLAPGRTTIFSGANVFISGNVFLARLLDNFGTITWQSGNISFSDGLLLNRPAGTFNVQSTGSAFSAAGTTNQINNNGTLRRNGTSPTASNLDVRLANVGSVEVVQGTLRLRGGGTAFGGSLTANPFTTLFFANTTYVMKPLAVLAGGGTHAFTSGAHAILGPFSGVGTLLVQGATLTLAGPALAAAKVTLSAGELDLVGSLTANTSMNWTGGKVTGPGTLVIASGASLGISGAAEKYLENVTLANSGTVLWGGGRLNLLNASIENAGVFRALGERIRSLGGASSITTTGEFRKESGLTLLVSNVAGGVAFNIGSAGELIVQAGTLTLLGGGLTTGTIRGFQTGSLVIGGVPFTIAGGVINDIPSVEITGPAQWTAGAILGAGQIIVSPGFNFDITGPATKTLGRTLTNNGSLSWIDGILQINAASIVNAAGATMNIGAVNGLSGFGGDSSIQNLGTINKVGGAALSFEASNVTFSNTGTLNVLGGSLTFDGLRVVQMAGATLNGGTWNLENGADLDFTNTLVLVNNATVSLSGAGVSFNALHLLTLNNGSLTVSNAALPLQSNGGQFTNRGILSLNQSGSLVVIGNVIFDPASVFNLTLEGPSAFGHIDASGSLQLAGTVSASFLFTPFAGSQFQFLEGSSRTGDFTAEFIFGLPGGLNGDVQYLGNGARIAVT